MFDDDNYSIVRQVRGWLLGSDFTAFSLFRSQKKADEIMNCLLF